MKGFILTLGSLVILNALAAQGDAMPKVFVLGQQETGYEQLNQSYKQSLLEACNNDMQAAFDRWLEMMQEMENYAARINYNDLKGVKVLMHVFWNEDGTVAHLGYFVRPDSRLVKAEELSAFFTSFLNQYKFPVTSNRKFAHYTKASFPTFTERAQR